MPRPLSLALDHAQLSTERRPGYEVLAYDVRSGKNAVGDVVRGVDLDPLTGPRDLTADVVSARVEEVAGDYAGDGVAASSVTLEVADPHAQLDPIANPGGDGRWLRRGNVVRLREGDLRVPREEWPTTFTGLVVGQAGVVEAREPGARVLTVKAVGREAGFLGFKSTSSDFALGTSYKSMVEAIAEEDMGLDTDELALGNFGAQVTGHASTQLADEPPLVHVARIMFVDGFMPRFRGDGKLSQSLGIVSKQPARAYADAALVRRIERPHSTVDPTNRVVVVGLSATREKVSQPRQVLATAEITTGYFTQDEELEVYWSDDRTLLADAPRLEVLRSVNGGLAVLGGGEFLEAIPAPIEGTQGGRIQIATGFSPYVVVFLTAVYLTFAALPDVVPVPGEGVTLPVGRIAQAAALSTVLLLMTRIGRGSYRVTGEPFEYVFREIRAVAKVEGLKSHEVQELVIENHLVQSQAQGDAVARDVLLREQAKGRPRIIRLVHDLALEPDDAFELVDSGRRFLVEAIRRTLRRGGEGAAEADVEAVEITAGLAS